jgi:MoxR-like ATPase
VPVAPHVIEHAVAIARASRPSESSAPEVVRNHVGFGAGPRASQALILGAKARAVLAGRFAAEIEDVRALVGPIMRHRIVLNFRGEAEGVRPMQVLDAILRAIPG